MKISCLVNSTLFNCYSAGAGCRNVHLIIEIKDRVQYLRTISILNDQNPMIFIHKICLSIFIKNKRWEVVIAMYILIFILIFIQIFI